MSGQRRRFRFIKEIAEGGFGKVYLAEQLSADGFSRIVAIKLLHAKWSSHDEVVMRTRDEARLLGLIRHQHIVRVDDLASIDGKCAIVMEYLEGTDLKAMMTYLQEKQEPFPRKSLFEIMGAACQALDSAYNGGPIQGGDPLKVIHRDIKPSNIFVTVAGGVKVLDFGTARANFAQREAKTQALAFGSQGYMAPERMLGEEDTPAADIFSLGVTLYELLTGESFGRIPPRPNKFIAKVEERIAAIPLEGDPDWCDQVRDGLRGMLSYEPSERPTAVNLSDVFETLAQNAQDTGLRKFCRTEVAEAKAKEPHVESGDPLCGQTIEEDASGVLGIGAGGMPMSDSGSGMSSSDGFGTPSPPSGAGLSAAPPPPGRGTPAPTQSRGAVTVFAEAPDEDQPWNGGGQAVGAEDNYAQPHYQQDPHQQQWPSEVPEEGSGGGSKLGLILGGVGGIVVIGLIALVLIGVIIAVIAVVMMQPSGGGTVETDTKPPVETDTQVATPKGPTIKGCTVVAKDTRTGVKKAKAVTLKFTEAKGGDVVVTGGVGFKAEWDGLGDCALGDIGEGSYRTNVEPVGGSGKIRGKGFSVDGGKTCEFTFDVGKKEWGGSCK